ncbi:MAG: hexameric tyrosine-coordinated heme protein [Oleiphilaceae bacterium]|nr:hexameric tyrosine-coordinated heme protein [Oleiphilaceae bacterium]
MKTLYRSLFVILVAAIISISSLVVAEEKSEPWLPTLITETPQEGFELAIKLSRMGVKKTQPDTEVLFREREKYSQNADDLMVASQVIALNFETVAAANNYWREQ